MILPDQVDLAVEITAALDFDDAIAFQIFDEVRFFVAIGIERYLVVVAADAPGPLIRTASAAAMSGYAVRVPVAGGSCER